MKVQQRKAISPLIATIILIAITIIGGAIVANLFYSTASRYADPSQVSATATLYAFDGPTGTITLTNAGDASASVAGVTIAYGGQTCSASYTTPSDEIPSGLGTVLTVQQGQFPTQQCGQAGGQSIPQQGEAYTVEVTLSGGAQIPIAGQFD